jgi:SAM-dependent methyltransferase
LPREVGSTPWSAMQPEEALRFGEEIFDPAVRARWCAAVLVGGLPYLWTHKARIPRKIALDQLELRPGDRVYINGEALEAIGIPDDVRERVGPTGEVVVDDFMERVRDLNFRGEAPRWQWDYTHGYSDGYFDSVLVFQGVAHAGDWAREGAELLRVLKSGRQLVLAEIGFGTSFNERVAADVHIEYYLEKLFDGLGGPFHLPEVGPLQGWEISEVRDQLAPMIDDLDVFRWRGVDLLWGRKPV